MSVIPLNASQYYLLFDLGIICNYIISKARLHYRGTKKIHQNANVGSGSLPVASRMYTEVSFTRVKLAET